MTPKEVGHVMKLIERARAETADRACRWVELHCSGIAAPNAEDLREMHAWAMGRAEPEGSWLDGTPAARLEGLFAELDKRFPGLVSEGAALGEAIPRFLAAIDAIRPKALTDAVAVCDEYREQVRHEYRERGMAARECGERIARLPGGLPSVDPKGKNPSRT